MRHVLLGSAAVVAFAAAPLVARNARHDRGDGGVAETRTEAVDDTAAVARLLRVVRGADPLLCELAVRNVDQHGWWGRWGPTSGDPLETDSASAAIIRWIQGEKKDARMVPTLTTAIRDADACTRRIAGSFLGRIDHPAARSALLSALDDGNAGTRASAALGLGLAEDRAAIQPLIRRLRDENAGVRRASAWALGSIEDKAAMEPLIDVLQRDTDARVRQAAAWAIGNATK